MGEKETGKTLLIHKFINYEGAPRPNQNKEERYKFNTTLGNKPYSIEILDTFIPEEDNQNIFDMWTSYGEGFLLVFSIDNEESFESLNDDRERILKSKHKDFIPMVLVGNKQDLSDKREVSYEEAKKLSDSWGVEYIETSALNNYNCKEAFEKLVIKIASAKIKPKKSSCCNCFIF